MDDLREAMSNAISAGTGAARAQGTAIKGDFETLIKPQLDDIAVQMASITSDFIAGNIGKEQAQEDLQDQCDRIQPLVLAEAELALMAVQQIINAVVTALKTAVNTAAGLALL
jgi:hypothetical protein